MNATATEPLSTLDREVIDLFVNVASTLGIPRSVGEIYGLLFIAPEPLAMDDVISRLQISVGSASQGLKILRALGAVKPQYVLGDRRDHYVAETELRPLVAGFLKEHVNPHLESGSLRLEKLRRMLAEADPAQRRTAEVRIEKLERWHKVVSGLLPLIQQVAAR